MSAPGRRRVTGADKQAFGEAVARAWGPEYRDRVNLLGGAIFLRMREGDRERISDLEAVGIFRGQRGWECSWPEAGGAEASGEQKETRR